MLTFGEASDMNITRGEARQIGGEFYFYPGTDIATIEISTFHVLHCLVGLSEKAIDVPALTLSKDQVRRSVYWKHYWPDGVGEAQQVHIGTYVVIRISQQYTDAPPEKTIASTPYDSTSSATWI